MAITLPAEYDEDWFLWAQTLNNAVNGDNDEITGLVISTIADALTEGTNVTIVPDLGSGTITVNSPRGDYGAQDQGFISWSGDPAYCSNGNAPTAGVLYLQKHVIRKDTPCIGATLAATSGGTSPTNCYVALHNSSGSRVALTSDQASNWGTSGVKAPNWSSRVDLTAGVYYTSVLVGGGTAPAFLRAGNTGGSWGGAANLGLSAPGLRFGSIGTAQTSVPSSVTLGSVAGVAAETFVVALRAS